MAKTVFYKKEGRKYIPVKEYDPAFDNAWPYGNHLVMRYKGGEEHHFNIEPALAPMIAAGRFAEDAMTNAVVEASKLRPTRAPITEGQRKAWNKLQEEFGDELATLQIASAREIAEVGIKGMMNEANKMLEIPAVKNAYDHFMLVYKLTKDADE